MRSAALLVGTAIVLAGCKSRSEPTRPERVEGPATATAPVDAGPTATAAFAWTGEGPHPAIKLACSSCHTADMIACNRLTEKQWAATVHKMVGFGALVDAASEPGLASYLAKTYGPDAAPYQSPPISAKDALAALEPLPDGAFVGTAEAGKALFEARCQVCHGPDAHGGVGVNLTDRPLLYRAPEFAATVRSGRGQMPPWTDLKDGDIGSLLAYLRTLPGVKVAAQ